MRTERTQFITSARDARVSTRQETQRKGCRDTVPYSFPLGISIATGSGSPASRSGVVLGRRADTKTTVSATTNGASAPTDRNEQSRVDTDESELPGVDYGQRWSCPACGHPSTKCYRCEECGHDFADDGTTAGQMEVPDE